MRLHLRDKAKSQNFTCIMSTIFTITLSQVSIVQAQDVNDKTEAMAEIFLELNKAELVGEGCRLTFLSTNNSDAKLNEVAFEFAFLDKNGQLAKLATLNFGGISPKRPKITQFTLPDQNCTDLSQAFLNSEAACDGAEKGTCLDNIVTTSNTNIEF